MDEATLKNQAGQQLFFRAWRPTGGARAVLAVVPGFNSHSGHYQWLAEQLLERGVATYALDLRGRGKSEGERFFVESFDDYVSDVTDFMRVVKAREPSLPTFLLGHSAGGVVSCLYALAHQQELAGLLCESFAFQVPAPDFALAVLKGLSHIVPHAHVLTLHNRDFSRDAAVVAALDADPLIAGESQPTQTVAAMVRADEKLAQSFGNITLPVLIMHGTADKATRPSGSQLFFEQTGSTDKTLKLYEGSFHDPLNDLDRALVLSDISAWLGAHVKDA
jgi:acylglycerol lipase